MFPLCFFTKNLRSSRFGLDYESSDIQHVTLCLWSIMSLTFLMDSFEEGWKIVLLIWSSVRFLGFSMIPWALKVFVYWHMSIFVWSLWCWSLNSFENLNQSEVCLKFIFLVFHSRTSNFSPQLQTRPIPIQADYFSPTFNCFTWREKNKLLSDFFSSLSSRSNRSVIRSVG